MDVFIINIFFFFLWTRDFWSGVIRVNKDSPVPKHWLNVTKWQLSFNISVGLKKKKSFLSVPDHSAAAHKFL